TDVRNAEPSPAASVRYASADRPRVVSVHEKRRSVPVANRSRASSMPNATERLTDELSVAAVYDVVPCVHGEVKKRSVMLIEPIWRAVSDESRPMRVQPPPTVDISQKAANATLGP